MKRVSLVTDSAAGMLEVFATAGIGVVPGSFALADRRTPDGPAAWADAYRAMRSGAPPPRTFSPVEADFVKAFRGVLDPGGEAPAVCLVTPFDVAPTFTTASAAMLTVQDTRPDALIKISNPGVGCAGLAALLLSLSTLATGDLDSLLEAAEALEPRSDCVCVPQTADWLEQTGRLSLIEERLGGLDGELPVLRVGTRFSPVARAGTFDEALEKLPSLAAARAAPGPFNAVILHADNEPAAQVLEGELRTFGQLQAVHRSVLPLTIGAQLGPGAVALGIAPVLEVG